METQNSKNLDHATAATIQFFMVNKKTPSVCIEQPTSYSSALNFWHFLVEPQLFLLHILANVKMGKDVHLQKGMFFALWTPYGNCYHLALANM